MRVNLITNTLNINKFQKVNKKTYSPQVSFNGFGDFVTFQKDKIKYKKEAQQIQRHGYSILNLSKEIHAQAQGVESIGYDVYKKSKNINRDARLLLDEFQTVLTVTNGEDGELGNYEISTIEQNGNSVKVVEKFKDETTPKPSHKIVIDENEIRIYSFSKNDAIDSYVFDKETFELKEYDKDIKFSAIGFKTDERYVYKNGKLVSFAIGYKNRKGKDETAQKYLEFADGKLKTYTYDYENTYGEYVKFDSRYIFDNGEVDEYIQGYRSIVDVCETIQKRYQFNDGELCFFEQYCENNFNSALISDITFSYLDSHPWVATIGAKTNIDGSEEFKRLVSYEKSAPKEFYEGLQIEALNEDEPHKKPNETYATKIIF